MPRVRVAVAATELRAPHIDRIEKSWLAHESQPAYFFCSNFLPATYLGRRL